jgi:hypothetical protein
LEINKDLSLEGAYTKKSIFPYGTIEVYDTNWSDEEEYALLT